MTITPLGVGCITPTRVPVTVTMNAPLALSASVSSGYVSGTATGGTPPYQFSLNGGAYTPINTFDFLCSGTYTLSVKDNFGAGCILDTVVTIQANTNFTGGTVVPYTVTPSCALAGNGMISLIVTPPGSYQYLWNTGDTTSYIDSLNQGIYNVKIMNAANECVENSYTITAVGNTCGNISGNVYFDENLNCIKDSGEFNIQNTLLVLNPGNHMTFTDCFGNYSYSGLNFGNYNISHANNISSFVNHCGNPLPVSINAANPNPSIYFGDSVVLHVDFRVNMNSLSCFVIPDPQKSRTIIYKHANPSPLVGTTSGTIYAVFDSISHFVSAVPPPSSIVGDSVFWNVNNISTIQQYIQVDFQFPPAYTSVNTCPFRTGIKNTLFVDTILWNNHNLYTLPFCWSYDPNAKHVAPKGDGVQGYLDAYDPSTKLMTYEIQFQNTGNATAYNIVVEDTLSDKLDLTTFQVIDYSHSYQLEVINNQILKWKFYNIMLPDSNTNEPASHGHIIYQVRQLPTNMPGDVIKNKAHIYFDFNPAIITNETVNTLTMVEGMNEVEQGAHIVIYPNPATDVVYIESEREFTELRVYDAQMKLLRTIQSGNTRSLKMNTSALSAGLYYIKTNNGQVKKLLIATK